MNRIYQLSPGRVCHRAFLPLLLTVFMVAALDSNAARHERLIDSWKPMHYDIALTFNDQLTEVTNARAEITVTTLKDRVSLIDLDFGQMTVDSVAVNKTAAPFEHISEGLRVHMVQPVAIGARLVIVVLYHGRPKDGLILTKDKDGRPAAIGDNWPNRVHDWIPCFDHPSAKATVSFSITAPARDLVVANGSLDRVRTVSDSRRTWTYTERAPIPPYCMVVGVGEFGKIEATPVGGTSLWYYVPPSNSKSAVKGFAPAGPSLKLFSEMVAAYPYEKLALIVGATRFGGMENSSAIVFPGNIFDASSDAPSSAVFDMRLATVATVAHEIAHQWFGDSVTEATWSDLWLSEGFATYFAGLFIQRYEGEEAFQKYLRQAAESYLQYERQNRTPLFDTQTEDLYKLLNPNNYEKGAWVLHMLQSIVGRDAFLRGIRTYYRTHKDSTATSEDLRLAMEQASGMNLRQFFNSWIYGTGHPLYELTWHWDHVEGALTLQLDQLQPEAAFPNWLPINVLTPAGKRSFVFKPQSKNTIEKMPLREAPTSIQVDPENTVLKEVTVKSR